MNHPNDPSRRITIFFPLLIISLAMILTRCEEESAKPADYPRITGMQVVNISDSGTTFIADLYSLGTEELNEYGFVWGTEKSLTINNSNRIFLGKPESTGRFTAEIKSTLLKSQDYYVRPFVKTSERTVYGPDVKFFSLGSQAPSVYGFQPHTAGWGDTVTVFGKNFSWLPEKNLVSLNEALCRTVSSTDTTLHFVITTEVKSPLNLITVDLAGNKNYFTEDTLKFIAPYITDFFPKKVFWGDTVTVRGKYFRSVVSNPLNSIFKIGSFPVLYLYPLSDTLVRMIVPPEVNSITSPLTFNSSGLTITASSPVTLLSPYFSFSPKEGKWGSTVKFKGKFHPTSSVNNIIIGGFKASISSFSRDSISIIVPKQLVNYKNAVSLEVPPFNITAPDSFSLPKPVIQSFSPLGGTTNTTVTINGKYLNNPNVYNFTRVKLGNVSVTPYANSESTIIFNVPSNIPNGPAKITVYAGNQVVVSDSCFIVKNPHISDFYPKSAKYDDEITIIGENLSGDPFVTFGNDSYARYTSANDSLVLVKVPDGVDSIPCKIKLEANDVTTISTDNFVLSPPEITGITPDPITTGGQDIIINGLGFNPFFPLNKIFWDIYPLTVKSVSSTQIIAALPSVIDRSSAKIKIIAGGYSRSYPVTNQIKSYWSHSAIASNILWAPLQYGYYWGTALSINGKEYMIDNNTGSMISFDPSTKSFASLGNHTIFRNYGLSVAVCRDTAYMIGYNFGLYRYNASTNTWVSEGASSPISGSNYNGVFFCLNDKLYYGLSGDGPYPNNNVLKNSLWMYNSGSKTWTQKNSLPPVTSKGVVSYFSMNNKGYALFFDNKFFEYDPVTNTWRRLPDYPGASNHYGRIAFVIDGKAYAGGGVYTSSPYSCSNDLYSFDPNSNTWILFSKLPFTGRYNSVSFVINNKGYILSGWNNSMLLKDLLEFDPNYTMK